MAPASAGPIAAAVSAVMPVVTWKTAVNEPKAVREERILIHSECKTEMLGKATAVMTCVPLSIKDGFGGGRASDGGRRELGAGGRELQTGLFQGGPLSGDFGQEYPSRAARLPICSVCMPSTVQHPSAALAGSNPLRAGAARSRSGSEVRSLALGVLRESMKPFIDRSANNAPCPAATRWSTNEAVSAMRWLETRAARPSAARERISSRIRMMPSRSRALVGSSSRTTPESPSSAGPFPAAGVCTGRRS